MTNEFGPKWIYDNPITGRRSLSTSKPPSTLVQSSMDLKRPAFQMFEYLTWAFVGLLVNSNPQRILLIGVGGASIHKGFMNITPQVKIDTVELDPQMVEIAMKYFDFKPSANVRIFIEDGFDFVKDSRIRNHQKYDFIVIDAFAGSSMPDSFISQTFMLSIRKLLSDNGFVIINTLKEEVTEQNNFGELRETCKQVFPTIFNVDCIGANRMIVASSRNDSSQIIAQMSQNAFVWKNKLAKIGVDTDMLVAKTKAAFAQKL